MLVHGELETDQGGSALWRMKEWEAAEDFTVCHYPKGAKSTTHGGGGQPCAKQIFRI